MNTSTLTLPEKLAPVVEIVEMFTASFGISIGIAAVLAVPAFIIGKAIG